MRPAPRTPVGEGDLVAGRYRVLRPIGKGAMSTVWAARHELLGRDFALKLASVSAQTTPDARARFLREAQIVGKLRHPNVVDVADVGDVAPGAGLYLAMELLQGESLADRIRDHAPLPAAEALAIVGEVCRGLAAAHAAGVIHRDIKPANIFLAQGTAGGIVPKLLDFGISKAVGNGGTMMTLSGKTWGTPAYMSPEQALGEETVDHRTDVWSLGVVLFEMLTGARPHTAESYPALLARIAEGVPDPLPLSVPAEARAIVARCLARSPADRYPTAEALRRALDAARAALGEPIAPSGRPIERSRSIPDGGPAPIDAPGPARSRATWILAGLALTAMVAAGIAIARPRAEDPNGVAPAPRAALPASAAPPPSAAPAASAPALAAVPPAVAPASVPVALPTATAKTRSGPAKSVTKINNAGF